MNDAYETPEIAELGDFHDETGYYANTGLESSLFVNTVSKTPPPHK